jgi:DNA-directed RNA polymerase beta' subunit
LFCFVFLYRFNAGLRKDIDSKIFQNPLGAKMAEANRSLGLNVETLMGMDFDPTTVAINTGKGDVKKERSESARYIPPSEVKERITRLFRNESTIVQRIFKSVYPNFPGATKDRVDPCIFFLDTILVPPGRFRPSAKGAMGAMDHPQNVYYKNILNVNHKLLDARREGTVCNFIYLLFIKIIFLIFNYLILIF